MSWIGEPFAYGFFRHGFVVAVLAGGLCGLVGTYVVLRGMSYIGHGLSHAIFGGAAASPLVSFNFYAGAGIWGMASALAIGRVTRRRGIGADAAIGVVTTASFALGVALLNRYGQVRRSLDAALFGSILGVSTTDVWVVVGVAAFAAAVVFAAYRPLLFVTFDPEVAEASGVRAGRVDAVLMLMLSVTILATMKVLGAVLVAAALVTPPTVARMLTDSFARMMWLSVAIGAACGAAGMLWSYHALGDGPPPRKDGWVARSRCRAPRAREQRSLPWLSPVPSQRRSNALFDAPARHSSYMRSTVARSMPRASRSTIVANRIGDGRSVHRNWVAGSWWSRRPVRRAAQRARVDPPGFPSRGAHLSYTTSVGADGTRRATKPGAGRRA